MITRSYILATAGHVDHGKSALVKAISGIDPDRLPEEKARGITIDLGFAHADILGPIVDGKPSTIRLGIVDVPGHEDFVKNMVAGVGSIDLALLVVAADDGWMPQTEEHLQILTYLGVKHAVVALTKIDLAESEKSSRGQVREQLVGTPFAQAPIIATSIISGRGIEELKQSIAEMAAEAPPQRDIRKPRLPVDRAFVLRGVGTVVTGTLIGGSLRRGQAVVVQPSAAFAKIRSIQTHSNDVELALPGTRVALNLPDLHIAGKGTAGQATIARGDVVTVAELGAPTDTIDVALERSHRLKDARPLKHGTRVRLHHASANLPARIFFSDQNPLLAGREAIAQMRLESPAFIFAGDRIVIRDWPEQQTLAGGLVLNPAAKRCEFRKPSYGNFVAALASAGDDASAQILATVSYTQAIPRQHLLVQSSFASEQLAAALAELAQAKKIVLRSGFIADAKWWQDLCRGAIEAIDAAHVARPHEPGLPIADLRAALACDIPPGVDPWEDLLAELSQNGFERSGAYFARVSHRPALPAHLAAAGEKIRGALRAHPMDPPSRKELAPDSNSFAALKFLLNSGEAIDIGAEVVMHSGAYRDAIDTIQKRLATGGATVSELKQALGSSRRVVVPLLEKLDREGITQRQGDLRVLKLSGARRSVPGA